MALKKSDALRTIADHRSDQVVVTCMSVVRPWGRISDHPLDFASADSAMGHTADFALGIALARPDRQVLCMNGDGSMLMTLGTLATAAGSGADNYVLIVVNNGTYEITGNQALPGGRVDFPALATASGFPSTFTFRDTDDLSDRWAEVLEAPGPVLVDLVVEPESEGPIGRRPEEPAAYLRVSLADSARVVKNALAEDA